jgi:hypothetical protein
MNSNADWAKCLTTLRGSHLINYGAKIIKLSYYTFTGSTVQAKQGRKQMLNAL